MSTAARQTTGWPINSSKNTMETLSAAVTSNPLSSKAFAEEKINKTINL